MQRNVEDWIRQCDSCQRNKFQRIAPPGKLHPLETPKMPWTSISMDWITCLPTTYTGYDAILVVVDRFSKLTHFIPCNSTGGAVATAIHLRKDIVRLHGIPEEIVSDRDSRFAAKVWRSLAELLNFKQKLSTSRHPQTDGQTENMNQELEDFLRHLIGPL
jgi:transposase InsO family protein